MDVAVGLVLGSTAIPRIATEALSESSEKTKRHMMMMMHSMDVVIDD